MGQAVNSDTAVLETIREVVDSNSAGKVFGHTVSQDGLTVLPVAKVSGGGAGGGGRAPGEDGLDAGGAGAGLGVSAKPLGVFVINGGRVSWRPAIDVNKVILGGQIVAVTALLVIGVLIRARLRRDRSI